MILGTNFSSESGPKIPLSVSLLIRFGGHVTTKKGTTWLFDNEKGSHLWHISTHPCANGVAQTVPEAFLPPTMQRLSTCPAACPTSAAARHRVPDSRCGLLLQSHAKSRPREVGGGAGWGRARLGLDWCGTLEQPHGRLLRAARCRDCRSHRRSSYLDLLSCSVRLLEPLTKAERLPKKFKDVCPVRQPVEQGRRQMFLPQHALPLAKFQVGGNDDGTAFVER